MSILVEHLDIEIRIWGNEVEDITFPHVSPVFPAYIPSLYEHLIQTILRSKVNITLNIFVIGLVCAIWLNFTPVYLVEFDAGVVVGVMPTATSDNHLPPYSTVLCWMNPRGILEFAWLIEIQNQIRCQHVTSIVADHNCTPRSLTRSLHSTLQSCCIRSKMANKGKCLRHWPRRRFRIWSICITASTEFCSQSLSLGINKLEVHSSIVCTSGLVDIDVKAVSALHLKRCLNTCLREYCN